GLLHEAIAVSNVFVPKGEIVVSTKGKVKNTNREYKTPREAADTTTPLAVLIDGGTASASEIVSGTIQDLDRGVIIGQTSFGKGLVQSTRPVAYNSQLKLTTSKYYIPSGRSIQRIIYSEKGEDGEFAEVPDSLRKAFTTRGGRTVLDGAGIEPDIKTDVDEYSQLSFVLFRNNHIYDYSLDYYNTHPTVASAADFTLTDQDFEAFKQFLDGKDYSYETPTEAKLIELKEKVEEDNYGGELDGMITALEDKLSAAKANDLDKYKDEILFLLEREIAGRYYYRAGREENSLDNDKEVQKALDVLANSTQYASILK
ncbi:MAG: S41 family peptidase, partial [Saprospiraceae bacterium]|nr:S41 family peptidase [Saprospiraceae bacterium]